MNIANIHKMSSSLAALTQSCQKPGSNWFAKLEETGWLNHQIIILNAVLKIVDMIILKQAPVFVHCSDGWDRVSILP